VTSENNIFSMEQMDLLRKALPKVFRGRKRDDLGPISAEEFEIFRKSYPDKFNKVIVNFPIDNTSGIVYVFGIAAPFTIEKQPNGSFTVVSTSEKKLLDVGNGVILDLYYWELWEKNPPDKLMTFEEATKYADNLETNDIGGWRLPHLITLFANFLRVKDHPFLPKFPNGRYWSRERDRYPLVTCFDFRSDVDYDAGRFPPYHKAYARCTRSVYPLVGETFAPRAEIPPTPEEDARFMEAISICN